MAIQASKIFEVFEDLKKRKIYTKNLITGPTLQHDYIVKQDNVEYREWEPYSSKLASAIVKKTSNLFIRKGDVVLYLGCASGTTVSHVSDMVGNDGLVLAVDLGPRVLKDLVLHLSSRKNVVPILEDANRTDRLASRIVLSDIVFQDIAQKSQVPIFLKNCKLFLKDSGYGILMVKARSVDVTKHPKVIFKEVFDELCKHYKVIDKKELDPFQKDHMMFIVKKG